jgi:uncharacterized protein (DUF362 family)
LNSKIAIVYDNKLDYNVDFLNKNNPVYKAVERLFYNLRLDCANYGKKSWNPLREIVKPHNKVVIKPNFVACRDREKILEIYQLEGSCTHPAVIKPIIDYVWKALNGQGEVSIVDSPLEGSNIEETIEKIGLTKLLSSLQNEGINVKFIDLRDFKKIPLMLLDNYIIGDYSINIGVLIKKSIVGDPKGYTIVDLKSDSYFGKDFDNHKKLRFHRSNPKPPIYHHTKDKNEYSVSNTVLEADVFINVPKLKTHKKCGVTLSLKSLIGITNKKYWLPHFQAGYPPHGDEFSQKLNLFSFIKSRLSHLHIINGVYLIINIVNTKKGDNFVDDGCWIGNDTLWRTILDMNKILLYTDKNGNLQPTKNRKYLTIIDGIIGGEGDGPLRITPKKSGILIAGFDPAAADLIATQIMGFDYKKIKCLTQINKDDKYPIGVIDKDKIQIIPAELKYLNLNFIPPKTWQEVKL